ncbi:MAG: hypothetical protein IKU17_07330 [Clostridia bacterium]|nr:hypothetical protein [Clostridia bacterium]
MDLHALFVSVEEPYAAGLFEYPDRAPLVRYANAQRRYFEEAALTPYDGGRLYPCGENIRRNAGTAHIAVRPDYSFTYAANWQMLREKTEEGHAAMAAETAKVTALDTPHLVGGNGYTHCFINYKRILAEGLAGYRARVTALPEGDFREAMLILLDGIETYRRRCVAHLREVNAPADLIEALEYVPEHSPRNIYEALVAWNFVFYVDGCDDIGALDRNLVPYFNGEDIVELIRELFSHVDANDGWSGPLGPNYNEITRQCIRAIQNGRRPNLQLLVKPDMPDDIWQEVYASLGTSCGQPALYNYEQYMARLRSLMPEIPEADWSRLAFGGCTETMLEGISAVGSDDAGINTALIFDGYMREHLAECSDFESFFTGLTAQICKVIVETMDLLNEYRRTRALYRPQPIHTLFVDDCIDKQRDFNDDGARYYWSVINVAGLINVIDSLSVIRTLVYEKNRYTAAELIEKMDTRDPVFLAEARTCPCYGVDDDRADLLGARLAKIIFDAFDERTCYPRGRFFPVANQFTTYVGAGMGVGATPDGRCCGAPLCDSMGAIHGNDIKGPTALLNSVAKLPLNRVIGTPILNMRMKKEHLSTMLKPLVSGFFEKGGMQLQISCISREEILDAMANPDAHRNLVVRIGGYSEYFNRLSPALKQSVLERTEY